MSGVHVFAIFTLAFHHPDYYCLRPSFSWSLPTRTSDSGLHSRLSPPHYGSMVIRLRPCMIVSNPPPLAPPHQGERLLAFSSREGFSTVFKRRLASNWAYPRYALSAVGVFRRIKTPYGRAGSRSDILPVLLLCWQYTVLAVVLCWLREVPGLPVL